MEAFVGFAKIHRLSREAIVTEKIDGTNAQIYIGADGEFLVGSRTRWITPQDDNHGFAAWAYANKDELMLLGPGRHFGEWWGNGIQRGYGLPKGDKRFWMFNTVRWCLHDQEPQQFPTQDPRVFKTQERLPKCCGLVPVLWRGIFDTNEIDFILDELAMSGSRAAPGYMNPEGIVAYHVLGNVAFKKTLGGDGNKGKRP